MEWIWIWDQQAADVVDNRQMSLIKNVCIITQSATKIHVLGDGARNFIQSTKWDKKKTAQNR